MDLLDFLRIKDKEFLVGNYYPKYPTSPKDDCQEFDYQEVDPKDRRYSKLLDTLEADATSCTIRTDDNIDFKIKGYIVTQDGAFWEIVNVIKSVSNSNTEEALRILTETVQTGKVIRLIQRENPMGLK